MTVDAAVGDDFVLETASPAETEAAAARLAACLNADDVICLRGDLGAGKTTFVRGLVRGLGSPALVSSPTFTLVHEYPGGRLPVFHFDAYRLNRGAAEFEEIGWTEYQSRGGVIVVEWPERVEDALPADRFEVVIEETNDLTEETRRLRLRGWGSRRLGDMARASPC